MHLQKLLDQHKRRYRERFLKKFAQVNRLTVKEAKETFADQIEDYIREKYSALEEIVEEIQNKEAPLLLNICRDPNGEKCPICDSNRPNIQKIREDYQEKIHYMEIWDSTPGIALYHVIFQGEGEKLLPLTAVVHQGDVKKYWAGQAVPPEEYTKYLDPLLKL